MNAVRQAHKERLCLQNGRQLIQLRPGAGPCHNMVVQNESSDVTVQYECQGGDYGRTHIRRESDSLVQIDSQGIIRGEPFSFVAEGRHVGACH